MFPHGAVKIGGSGVISIVIEIEGVAEILMVHKYLGNLIFGARLGTSNWKFRIFHFFLAKMNGKGLPSLDCRLRERTRLRCCGCEAS